MHDLCDFNISLTRLPGFKRQEEDLMKKNTYNIGEISKICNVPISKLRYYDKIGVITPAFVDDDTGYRYYDNDTIFNYPY